MLDQLLEQAKGIKPAGENYGIPFYGGVEYEKWVAKGILFIEGSYGGTQLKERFIKASETSSQPGSFDTMLGILQGLKELD